MLKKYFILICVCCALVLLITATRFYPGGSQEDSNSIGYDFSTNYICNLFGEKAVNGAENASRYWAIASLLFLCVGFALFFYRFSKKIPLANPSKIIRYTGVSAMCFTSLIASPLHDSMVTLSGTLALVSMFYITVYIFKSRLHVFKVLSIITLLVFYSCNIMYYFRFELVYLPIMQKVLLGFILMWMLGLEYFTGVADFIQVKKE